MSDWRPPESDIPEDIRMGEGLGAVAGRVSPETQEIRDRAAVRLRATFESEGDPTGLGDVEAKIQKVAGGKSQIAKAVKAGWQPPQSDFVPPEAREQVPVAAEAKTESGGGFDIGGIPIPQFGNLTLNDLRSKTIFGTLEKFAKEAKSRADAVNQLRAPDENGVSDVEREIARRKSAGQPFDNRSIEEWVDKQAMEMVHGKPKESPGFVEQGKQVLKQIADDPMGAVRGSLEFFVTHPEVLLVGPVAGIGVMAGESALEQKAEAGRIDYAKLGVETAMNAVPLAATHAAIRTANLSKAKRAELPPDSAIEEQALKVAADATEQGASLPEAIDRALRYMDTPVDERAALVKGAEDAAKEGIKPEGDLAEHTNRDQGGAPAEAGGGDRIQQGGQEPTRVESGAVEPEIRRPRISAELQRLEDMERRIATGVEGIEGEKKYATLRAINAEMDRLRNPEPEPVKPTINLEHIREEIGWAEEGGRIIRDPRTGEVKGRTHWIPKSDFWADRPANVTVKDAHAALDRVAAGEKLTPKQQKFVDYAREVLEKRTDEAFEPVREAYEERLAIQQYGRIDPKLLAGMGLTGIGAAYGYWLNKDPAEAVRGALIAGGLGLGALALGKTFSAARRVLDATKDTRYRIDHLSNDFLGHTDLGNHAVYQAAEGVKAMVPDVKAREQMTLALQSGDLSKLNPVQRETAIQARRFFDETGERAQKAGIGLDNLRENYVTQLWVPGVNSAKSLIENLQGLMRETHPSGPGMGTKTRFGMERTIPNYEAGMKAGLIPVTLDLAEIMRTYGTSVNKTIQNKKFIEALRRDMLPTGIPSVVRGDALEQVLQRQRDAMGGRELKKLSPVAADLEAEINRIKAPSDYVTIDHPQFTGYRVHRDIQAPLEALFKADNPTALARAAHAVSIAAKRGLFSYSLFHAKSLIDAMMGAGIKAAMGVPSALNKLKVGDHPALRELIYGGLNVVEKPLEADANAFRNAMRLIEAKAPYPVGLPVKTARMVQEKMDHFLWGTLHPSLKVATALAVYEKALIEPSFWQKIKSKSGLSPDWRGVPKEQIARDVSSYTNDIFGGIDWYRIADGTQTKYLRDLALGLASQRGRRLMQVMMLAPDWTVATARSMFKAVPGMSSAQVGALHRAYLARQAILYLTLYNGINQFFSGHNIWENKDKTMIDMGDGRRMQMAKHTMEPVHWLTQPAQQMINKLGYVPKEIAMQLLGKDWVSVKGGDIAGPPIGNRVLHAVKGMLPIPSTVAAQQGPGTALSGMLGVPIYGQTEEQKRQRFLAVPEEERINAAVERALGVFREKQEAGTKQRYKTEEQAAEAARKRVSKQYEKRRQEQATRSQ